VPICSLLHGKMITDGAPSAPRQQDSHCDTGPGLQPRRRAHLPP
jgi:hypothetical protein